jgi:hypothetical protein
VRDLSEQYPCLYGLRDHCEALGFAFRILSGEIERSLEILSQATPEPKTDEERVAARIYSAFLKQLPIAYASAGREQVGMALTRIIRELCDLCPHRLNAIRSLGARGAVTVEPQPLPPDAPPPTSG